MTQLLAQAIQRAEELSDQEQDVIAGLILREIESEKRWDRAFARSQDTLADLAAEALTEHRAGKTKRLDPETL